MNVFLGVCFGQTRLRAAEDSRARRWKDHFYAVNNPIFQIFDFKKLACAAFSYFEQLNVTKQPLEQSPKFTILSKYLI